MTFKDYTIADFKVTNDNAHLSSCQKDDFQKFKNKVLLPIKTLIDGRELIFKNWCLSIIKNPGGL